MNAVLTQIPAGRSIDANLKASLEAQIAAFLEGRGAPGSGTFQIPDLKYNGVKYAVDFTVVGNDGATFQIRLNKIV